MGAEAECDRIRGPWSPEEDDALRRLVERHGACNWTAIGREIPGRAVPDAAEVKARPCKRLSLSPDSPSSGTGTVSDRSDLSHGAGSGSGSGQVYRPVPRSGGFEPADCAMSRPAEDDDPLTSLSLSLPGTDQRFHHDRAHSQFQELPASPPLPSPSPPPPPPAPSTYPFSPDFMAAMQELIRAEVQRYMAGAGVRAGCGPAGGPELCMPQLVEGVMRAAAERVGAVGRIP
ncbi:transcription factor MYB44-like [Panicum miliaceum]|uniref:Transcription factor MYB44-like n=1 Tax=Panicum miliaceum TaxID=4540 RepID=A0A3L6PHR2_PANMI|nr:transcription factor MYB44-like [Panicum miliaceum]